jgi:site-specific DNA recombinase
VPDGAELVIVLRFDIAAILTYALDTKKPEFLNERAIPEELMGRSGSDCGTKRKKPPEGALSEWQGLLVAGA